MSGQVRGAIWQVFSALRLHLPISIWEPILDSTDYEKIFLPICNTTFSFRMQEFLQILPCGILTESTRSIQEVLWKHCSSKAIVQFCATLVIHASIIGAAH